MIDGDVGIRFVNPKFEVNENPLDDVIQIDRNERLASRRYPGKRQQVLDEMPHASGGKLNTINVLFAIVVQLISILGDQTITERLDLS